jgi:type VI secretion system protein ImpK
MNILVSAAMPLLLQIIRVKNIEKHNDPGALRSQVIRDINQFESQSKAADYPQRTLLAARYCLCTALDESILGTDWGSNSFWAQQTLLSLIHKETWGGERFFIILEKILEEDKQQIDLLELFYILLTLGYEGKYYNQDRQIREEVRHRLFRMIQIFRGLPQTSLSPSIDALQASLPNPPKQVQFWKLFSITAGVLLILWTGFNYQTYQLVQPVLKNLKTLPQELK